MFLEALGLVPVGTQLAYSCLLPMLKITQNWLSSYIGTTFFSFSLIPVPGGGLSYLSSQLNGETLPPLSYTTSEHGPGALHTCIGRPPPASPEACRKVGLLSLRSSTATCTVPVALRGGLPPSCTCTRSWKLLCCSRSRVWSVVTSPGSEDGDCDGMFKDAEPGNLLWLGNVGKYQGYTPG